MSSYTVFDAQKWNSFHYSQAVTGFYGEDTVDVSTVYYMSYGDKIEKEWCLFT